MWLSYKTTVFVLLVIDFEFFATLPGVIVSVTVLFCSTSRFSELSTTKLLNGNLAISFQGKALDETLC